MKNAPIRTIPQFTPDKSIMNAAKIIEPIVLASTIVLKLMGASNNLSKERPFHSKVIVTASMEVVPNRMLKDISPGRMSLTSTVCLERIKSINAQTRGKMMPSLY